MKTNKEIKPFKMRCENKEQFNKVKIILTENNLSQIAASGERDVLINAYLKDDVLVYTTFEKHFDEPEPELTYSDFMKLYGEEEVVFTREDMKAYGDFLSWYSKYKPSGSIGTYKYLFEEINSDTLLANFLSERTND